MTAPAQPTLEALAFVDSWEWKWVREKRVESALALDRFAAQRAAEAVKRARPILGDTAIRHAGTVHSHSGPCKPDCPATPPPGDAVERARKIVEAAFDEANHSVVFGKTKQTIDREFYEGAIRHVAAALQSERTAAASQAIEKYQQKLDADTVDKAHEHLIARLSQFGGIQPQEVIRAIHRFRRAAASQARREAIEECGRACRGPGNAVDAEQRIRALATPQESDAS
jgi:hypothetical protein